MPTTEVEDLLVTFVHHPVKNEPISYDSNLPQLDGQTDFLFNNNHSNQQKRYKNTMEKSNRSAINSNKKKKISNEDEKESKYFPLNNSSSSEPEKSAWEHMILAEQKLNSYRKIKTNEQKIFPVHIPTYPKVIHRQSNKEFNQPIRTKKRVRSKSKRSLSMEHSGKTILDYFKVIKRSSTNENIQYSPVKNLSINQSRIRSANYFDGCIVIDDDEDEDDNVQKVQPW
jgi:hypothetical protein